MAHGDWVSGAMRRAAWGLSQASNALRRVSAGREFEPRGDDIFVTTFPRSGTTWLLMIVYQIVTDGEMDLGHIAERIPWFEVALQHDRDLAALPSPRVFKSHLGYDDFARLRRAPSPPKFIYVARDVRDVVVSLYHHSVERGVFKGDFNAWFAHFVARRLPEWRGHVAPWWAHRGDPNVLFLKYEDLHTDRDAQFKRIAAFCGVTLSPEQLARVHERSSFDFMKQHERLFANHLEWEAEARWRKRAVPQHLRKGVSSGWKSVLTEEQQAQLTRLPIDWG